MNRDAAGGDIPIMKTAIIAVVLGAAALIAVRAEAASPEETYFAARDSAIAKVKAANKPVGPTDPVPQEVSDVDRQSLAALEPQLRAIIGAVTIEGFGGPAKINLDTLYDGYEGFGLLDGLVYGDVDAKTRVIVTTESLFRHWLREHEKWLGEQYAPLPQDAAAAVATEGFYGQAVLTDAAILRYADLPVRKPAGAAFVYAMLAARTQDDPPGKADEIFVALGQGGRVFIASTREFGAVGPIAACDAIKQELARRAAAATAPADGKAGETSDELSGKSDAEFLRCFAERAKNQKGFAAALRAAEALMARLPAR